MVSSSSEEPFLTGRQAAGCRRGCRRGWSQSQDIAPVSASPAHGSGHIPPLPASRALRALPALLWMGGELRRVLPEPGTLPGHGFPAVLKQRED